MDIIRGIIVIELFFIDLWSNNSQYKITLYSAAENLQSPGLAISGLPKKPR